MKIKTKLLTFIGGSSILLLVTAFILLVIMTTEKIEKDLFKQLENEKINISKQLDDLITTSARSYLSAVGNESEHIVDTYYRLYQSNELSFEKAEELVLKSLTEYNFLESGFIFITNNDGIIISHPDAKKIGTISPMQAWIRRQKDDERNFKSYEESNRNKIVYRVYNKNFDINICVTVFTSDFISALDMGELNKTISNINIGDNGYPFLLNKYGVVQTERDSELINQNILGYLDADNNKIFERIITDKDGYFTYKWLEKDGNIKNKFASFLYEKNSGLIIVITGYRNEVFGTVESIKKFLIIFGSILIILLLVIIYFIATTITTPIVHFTNRLIDISHGDGDLTQRMTRESKDEIGIMVNNFNYFLDVLHDMVAEIKDSASKSYELKDKIVYRINETSASIKKIHSNIVSIKNQSKQLKDSDVETLSNYLINSMTQISKGSEKISNSMDSVTENTLLLEQNTDKLIRKVNRFKI
ncbi:MAG: methyl-accepting chemotaxis protein [Spirochaetales bacterium]|nr:methyl-accepting chemotaxis protein [Spirochaetales bacterium]